MHIETIQENIFRSKFTNPTFQIESTSFCDRCRKHVVPIRCRNVPFKWTCRN